MENIKTRYQQAGEEIKALEVTITRANGEIEELENERSALRAQWLELLDAAQQAEDMSDPRNWRVGDLLTITGNNNDHEFELGETVKVAKAFDKVDCDLQCQGKSSGIKWWVLPCDLKFHSRPTK